MADTILICSNLYHKPLRRYYAVHCIVVETEAQKSLRDLTKHLILNGFFFLQVVENSTNMVLSERIYVSYAAGSLDLGDSVDVSAA